MGKDGAYVLDISGAKSGIIKIKHIFNDIYFNGTDIFISTLTYEGNLLFMVNKVIS